MKQLLGSKLASGVIRWSCSNHYNRLWRQWILSAKKCFGCPLNHLVIAVMTSASEWHYCPFSFLWGSKQMKDTWRQIRAVCWLGRASHLVHAHASCTRFTTCGQVTSSNRITQYDSLQNYLLLIGLCSLSNVYLVMDGIDVHIRSFKIHQLKPFFVKKKNVNIILPAE